MYTPFKVICGGIYKAGDIKAYNDESILFIIQDMLSGYAAIEELVELNDVLLQRGLCHTFIVDADRKFKSIFQHTMTILKIIFT